MLVPLIFVVMLLSAFPQSPPPSPAPSAQPSPTPSAAPSSTPQPSPPPSPSPAPSSTPPPTPLPSATPTATPVPLPTPLVLPADAPPQIVDLRISSTVFQSGDTVSGSVITSTNVASVELRLAGYSIPVPRTDYGVFAMTYQVPRVPFFAKHGYTLQVIARNTKGDQTERDLQVTLR